MGADEKTPVLPVPLTDDLPGPPSIRQNATSDFDPFCRSIAMLPPSDVAPPLMRDRRIVGEAPTSTLTPRFPLIDAVPSGSFASPAWIVTPSRIDAFVIAPPVKRSVT